MRDLEPTAGLVVIDVQRGFDDEVYWGPRNNPDCEANVEALVEGWGRTHRPVVLVRHESGNPDSPLRSGTPGSEFKKILAEVNADLVVTKAVHSAFYGTPDLGAWLSAADIGQLVICGIQTNMCVDTTARMAGDLGYDVVFAADATHTFDMTGPGGEPFTAEKLANATVTNLRGGGFARVETTADVLAAL